MARVTDPLLSRAASGPIGKALLFRAGKAGPRVSRLPGPRRKNAAAPTAAQAAVRARYSAAAAAWRALSPAELETWNADARAGVANMHGWALFLSTWQGGTVRPLVMQWNDGRSAWNDNQKWG